MYEWIEKTFITLRILLMKYVVRCKQGVKDCKFVSALIFQALIELTH